MTGKRLRKNNPTIALNQYIKSDKTLWIIYADLESLLKNIM